MANYANQTTVETIKEDIHPPFLQLNEIEWIYASNTLNLNALRVYFYLAQNQNHYKQDFSPTAIGRKLGYSAAAINRARHELEDKGFLIDGKFYTRPPKLKEKLIEMTKLP